MGQELGAGLVLLRRMPQEKGAAGRNAASIRCHMNTLRRPVPRSALLLGSAGLIPFIVLAAMAWTLTPADQALATFALRAYAVTIVSFLGAIHWGLAMRQLHPDKRLLWWGVTPSLVAWVSLLVAPVAGCFVLVATLWLCFWVDRRVYPAFGLQAWLRMRLVLTTVASASCLMASGIA